MRKIERQMLQALVEVKDWSKDNTRVETNGHYSDVYLHGHRIAEYKHSDSSLKVNNCGYATNTTKSRLNALIDFVADPTKNGIFQKNWEWFIRINGDTHSFPDDTWVNV